MNFFCLLCQNRHKQGHEPHERMSKSSSGQIGHEMKSMKSRQPKKCKNKMADGRNTTKQIFQSLALTPFVFGIKITLTFICLTRTEKYRGIIKLSESKTEQKRIW